jgi:murein DD-endopeptidase MepM/ murein hydrolase activator NlpD
VRAAVAAAAATLIILIGLGGGRPVLAANYDSFLTILLLAAAKKAEISSPYGQRRNPETGEPQFHRGIDVVAPIGTPIHSPADATVDRIFSAPREGHSVVLRSNHTEFLFFHLDTVAVSVGDLVNQGDVIGTLGNSGECTGPHLHFSVKQHGDYINPKQYFDQHNNAAILLARKEQ